MKAAFYFVFAMSCLSVDVSATPNIEVLDRDLSSLIGDFNAQADRVRLFFIIGPTCPVCKKGLKQMKENVLTEIPENSDLSIFIVHVPALNAQQGDIADTLPIFSDKRAKHYWDEMGTSGIRFQRALGIPSYAWDVWMIYSPQVVWDVKDPPTPLRWWHQLKNVSPENRFNSKEFAAELNGALLESNSEIGDRR